jgi:hypothetical protein
MTTKPPSRRSPSLVRAGSTTPSVAAPARLSRSGSSRYSRNWSTDPKRRAAARGRWPTLPCRRARYRRGEHAHEARAEALQKCVIVGCGALSGLRHPSLDPHVGDPARGRRGRCHARRGDRAIGPNREIAEIEAFDPRWHPDLQGLSLGPPDWSEELRRLLGIQRNKGRRRDTPGGGSKPAWWGLGFAEDLGQISPDGRWIAYVSDEHGELASV